MVHKRKLRPCCQTCSKVLPRAASTYCVCMHVEARNLIPPNCNDLRTYYVPPEPHPDVYPMHGNLPVLASCLPPACSFDNEWYIVPFCAKHNNRANTKQMWLDARVRAVSANVHEMGCAADIRRKDSPGSGPGSGYNSRGGSPGRGSGCDSGYNSPW